MAGVMEYVKNQFNKNPGFFFGIILIVFILPISFIRVYDIDIWWHMQCGRSILENWSWPDFSDFYFSPVTQNTDSLRYTWLGDIIFQLIYLVSGDMGLQLLRLAFVIAACFILHLSAGRQYKGWHITLLMLLVVGTYQKQIIRNSIFALLLVPVLFWVWDQLSFKKKENIIWLYPILLGVWSCLHGSYLLGFALVFLIFMGDAIDILRGVGNGTSGRLVKYVAVGVLSFGVISFWNPMTLSYFNVSSVIKAFQIEQLSGRKINPEIKLKTDTDREKEAAYPELAVKPSDFIKIKESSGLLGSLKVWLNNTIFRSAGPIQSADFMSPFDALYRLYVHAALFSGAIGLFFIVFLIRPFRFSMAIPFAAVLVAGLGYLRLVGYIPIVTTVVIFQASGNNEIRSLFKDKIISQISWSLALVFTLLLWVDCGMQFPVKIGTHQHVFGPGRVPVYSEKCPDIVLAEYRDNNVFTTMTTGGYLLYRWYPQKKVFADGFFSPHGAKVMLHLKLMKEKNINPDFLYGEYGIDVALVDHTSGSVLNNFFNSENWYIRYIDTGMVCFVYQPDFESDIPVPEVLFDSHDLENLPGIFKKLAVNSLHTIPNALYKKGRTKDGIAFESRNDELLNTTRKMVDPEFIAVTKSLRFNGKAVYGKGNSKAQFYEYKHNAAVESNDVLAAVEYGLKVLEESPDRLPVILNLAIAFYKLEQYEKSLTMLEKISALSDGGKNVFFDQNKRNIAKFYWVLSVAAKKDRDYFKSYSLAVRAFQVDSTLISKEKLYQTGIELVTILNEATREHRALVLLQIMEKEFEDSGRWLNDIAWQIVITGKNSELELARAVAYGLKAVTVLKNEESNLLDLAYDTLAEISLRQGKTKEACRYIQSALLCAPEGREKSYENRVECD